MASLESQQKTIINLLDEALARAVRVVECRTENQKPARSVKEIRREVDRGNSQHLQQIIKGQPVLGVSTDLHEGWLAESLSAAKQSILQITPRIVRATRRAGQSTDDIFETHISAADNNFTSDPAGVFHCLKACFDEQKRYKAEGVEELASLILLGKTIRRRLRLFKSRFLSLVFSGWLWSLVLVLALASIPAYYYYGIYEKSHAQSLIKARPIVAEQAREDVAKIRANAEKPEKNFFEKTVSVVEGIWKLIDDVPKIFTAVTVAWGLFLAWLRR